jgi:DNA-binding response OmpR family regulator
LKVLVATADPEILERIGSTLQIEGFTVLSASQRTDALQRWQSDEPDVVLLDTLLPPNGGFDVCRAIRKGTETPVILLAASNDDDQIVTGFTAGADDVVTRPYASTQLALRIRAVCGRYAVANAAKEVLEIRVGDLIVDLESHQIRTGRSIVLLTPIELRLLSLLALNEGIVVGFSRLIEHAWIHKVYSRDDLDALKTHMTHLRKKLRRLGGQPADIGVVPRSGYFLPRTRKTG